MTLAIINDKILGGVILKTKYIWLSYCINCKTPVYGGGRSFHTDLINKKTSGYNIQSAFWCFPNHLGTHVDAPRHFYKDGMTIDNFDPSFWVFKNVALLEVQIPEKGYIIDTKEILPLLINKPELLLIKTGMGSYRHKKVYWDNGPGLGPELGKTLRRNFPSLRAVGIDTISINSWKNQEVGREAHRTFLNPIKGKPFILIEDMDLSQINSQVQLIEVIVLPIRVEGADGSPCTILAKVKHNAEDV
jgi:arylformamidase